MCTKEGKDEWSTSRDVLPGSSRSYSSIIMLCDKSREKLCQMRREEYIFPEGLINKKNFSVVEAKEPSREGWREEEKVEQQSGVRKSISIGTVLLDILDSASPKRAAKIEREINKYYNSLLEYTQDVRCDCFCFKAHIEDVALTPKYWNEAGRLWHGEDTSKFVKWRDTDIGDFDEPFVVNEQWKDDRGHGQHLISCNWCGMKFYVKTSILSALEKNRLNSRN